MKVKLQFIATVLTMLALFSCGDGGSNNNGTVIVFSADHSIIRTPTQNSNWGRYTFVVKDSNGNTKYQKSGQIEETIASETTNAASGDVVEVYAEVSNSDNEICVEAEINGTRLAFTCSLDGLDNSDGAVVP